MHAFIPLGRGGILASERILAVASVRSAPVKRLLAHIAPERIVNLSYGYPRETVVLMEGGMFIITSLTVEQLTDILTSENKEVNNEP